MELACASTMPSGGMSGDHLLQMCSPKTSYAQHAEPTVRPEMTANPSTSWPCRRCMPCALV